MKPLLSELLNRTLNDYQVELKEKQDLISKYKLGEIGVEQLPKQNSTKENRKEINPHQDKKAYTKELATVIADSLTLQIVYNLAHYDYHEMWYSVPCIEALKYSEITKEHGNGWGITIEHACGEPYLSLRQLIDLEPKDKVEFDLCDVQLDAFKKKFDYCDFHYGVINRFREYGIYPIRPKLKNGEEPSRLSMYFGLYEEETKQEDLYKVVREVLKLRSLVGDVDYKIKCLIEDSLVVLQPDCLESLSNIDKEGNMKEDLINNKKAEYEKLLQEKKASKREFTFKVFESIKDATLNELLETVYSWKDYNAHNYYYSLSVLGIVLDKVLVNYGDITYIKPLHLSMRLNEAGDLILSVNNWAALHLHKNTEFMEECHRVIRLGDTASREIDFKLLLTELQKYILSNNLKLWDDEDNTYSVNTIGSEKWYFHVEGKDVDTLINSERMKEVLLDKELKEVEDKIKCINSLYTPKLGSEYVIALPKRNYSKEDSKVKSSTRVRVAKEVSNSNYDMTLNIFAVVLCCILFLALLLTLFCAIY